MPRPARPWFRFYVETPMDMKVRRLSVKHRWLWVCVLGAARQSPKPGWLLITDTLPCDAESLADYAGMPKRDVTTGLTAMQAVGLVELDGGVWRVPNWDARQYEGDFARTSIPEAVKAAVMARCASACVECGATDDLTLDHIVAVTKGGTDDLDNLQVMCRPCNSRKGNRTRQQRYRNNARNGEVTEAARNESLSVTAPETDTETNTNQRENHSVELVVVDASPPATDPVHAIFDAWKQATGHHKSILDKKRRTAIVNARKHYPDADLIDAVRGVHLSPHNAGQNERGTVYDDIALVLRDSEHVEKFRDLTRGEGGPVMPRMPAGSDMTARWLEEKAR